jgi:hypothetical protein
MGLCAASAPCAFHSPRNQVARRGHVRITSHSFGNKFPRFARMLTLSAHKKADSHRLSAKTNPSIGKSSLPDLFAVQCTRKVRADTLLLLTQLLKYTTHFPGCQEVFYYFFQLPKLFRSRPFTVPGSAFPLVFFIT